MASKTNMSTPLRSKLVKRYFSGV